MPTESIWTCSANGLEDDGVTATDYSDPQLWDDLEAYGAVALDQIPVLEFFKHAAGVFSGSGTLLTISGTWVTDVDHPIILRTRLDQRHDGTPAGSVAQYTATNNAIFVTANQVNNLSLLVEGIYFRTNAAACNYSSLVQVSNASNIWIDGCLCLFDNHGGAGSEMFTLATRAPNVRIRNNISIDNIGTLDRHIELRDMLSPSVFEVYNNVLIGGEIGLDRAGTTLISTNVIKNNIVQGATTNYNLLGTYVSAANISSDATSPEVGLRNISLTFFDAVNDDYHLAAGDTAATDTGEDLTTAFLAYPNGLSIDIDRDTRPTGAGTWSIGADQFIAAGGAVALAGALAAASAVSGAASAARAAVGAMAAVSALSGAAGVVRSVIGSANSASGFAGILSRARALAGASAAVSAFASALSRARAVAGAMASVSAMSGTLAAAGEVVLAGIVTASTTMAGMVTRAAGASGTLAAASVVSGALSRARTLAGALVAATALSGSLSGAAAVLLAGAMATTSAISGAMAKAQALAGQVAASSSFSASASVARVIAGIAAAVSTATGALSTVGIGTLFPFVRIRATLRNAVNIIARFPRV